MNTAHHSQDANSSINEGFSLLPHHLLSILCKLQWVWGYGLVYATSPASSSSGTAWLPMQHTRLRAELLPLAALLDFSLITKIWRGSTTPQGSESRERVLSTSRDIQQHWGDLRMEWWEWWCLLVWDHLSMASENAMMRGQSCGRGQLQPTALRVT